MKKTLCFVLLATFIQVAPAAAAKTWPIVESNDFGDRVYFAYRRGVADGLRESGTIAIHCRSNSTFLNFRGDVALGDSWVSVYGSNKFAGKYTPLFRTKSARHDKSHIFELDDTRIETLADYKHIQIRWRTWYDDPASNTFNIKNFASSVSKVKTNCIN